MIRFQVRGPVLTRRSITFFALVAVGAAAACTFGGLDGVSGGVPDSGASSSSSGASLVDGAPNTIANDEGGTALPDGGKVDATVQNPPTFCVPHAHTFCFDFEDGHSFDDDMLFTDNANNRGSIDLSTDFATSGTHSVKIHMPRRKSTDGSITTQLYHNQTAPWTKTHIEVSFYIVPPQWHDGDTDIPIFGHVFYDDNGSMDVYGVFANGPSGISGAATVQIPGPQIPTGQWVRGIIDFDPAGTISGTINGVSYPAATFAPYMGNTNPGQGAGFGFYGFTSPTPDTTIYFDDFTIDW